MQQLQPALMGDYMFRNFWRRIVGSLAILSTILVGSANAQDNTSVALSKKFYSATGALNPSPNPGETFRLRITISNDTAAPIVLATGAAGTPGTLTDAFTDNGLPGGARANSGLLVTTSPPTYRVVPGSNCGTTPPVVSTNTTANGPQPALAQVTIGGITVPDNSSGAPGKCEIEIDVTTSKTGSNRNTIPADALTLPRPDKGTYVTQAVSEVVTVPVIANPSVDKGFGALGSGDVVGNSVTLNTGTAAKFTLRITNNDSNAALNNVRLSDLLPPGLTYATSPAPVFGGNCQGVAPAAPTATLTPVGNPNNVSVSIPRIPAGASCDIEFQVSGTSAGAFTNTINPSAIITQEGVSNTNTVARGLTYQSLDSAKSFDAPTTLTRLTTSNTQTISTTLRLVITNRLNSAVSNVTVTDYFTADGTSNGVPLGLETDSSAISVAPPSCVVGATLQGATNIPNATPAFAALAAGQRGIRLTGLTIPALGTCTITTTVRGAANSTEGIKTNTLLAANVTANGNQAVFQNSSADVTIVPPGVTGTIITVQKDSSNSTDVAGNLAAAPTWDGNTAAALLDVAPNPPSTRSGFHRIILRLPAAPPTIPAKTITSFTDDLNDTPTYDQPSSTGCGTPSLTLNNAGNKTLVVGNTTLTQGTDCIIIFRAKSLTAGTFTNTIPAYSIISTDGTSNIGSDNANLIFRDTLVISKGFAPTQVGPGGTTRLTINITNNDNSRPINITNLSDNLATFVAPDDLTIAPSPQISTSCRQADGTTPATITAAGNTVSMTNARLPAAGSGSNQGYTCSYSLFVIVPAVAPIPPTETNTIPSNNITSTENATNAQPASAALTIAPASVTVSKVFDTPSTSPGIIDPGDPSQLEITLTNTNNYTISGLDLTDYFTKGGIAPGTTACSVPTAGTDPDNCFLPIQVAAIPNASSTCNAPVTTYTAGSSSDVPATPIVTIGAGSPSRSVRLQGGALAPGGFCKIFVDVTGFIAGNNLNRIPINTLVSDQRATNQVGTGGFSAESTLTIFRAFKMEKSFTPTTVVAGTGISRLRLLVRNAINTPLTSFTVTDYFTSDGTATGIPTGMKIAPVPNTPATTTCGGTLTANPNDTSWSLSNGTIPSGATCFVEVDVVANRVGVASAPTFLNLIPKTNASANDGSGTLIVPRNGTQATLTTTSIPPTVGKSYNPTRVEPGASSNLTITLSNYSASIATLIAPFTDSVSSSLQLVSVVSSLGCNAASLSTTATSFTYATGGTIAAAVGATPGTCTIVLQVRGATNTTTGSFLNTIPTDALKTDRGSNPSPTQATLDIIYPLVGYKAVQTTDADNSGTITVGDTLTWSVFYKNEGTAPALNVSIADTLGANMAVSGTPTIARATAPGYAFTAPNTVGMNASFTGSGAQTALLSAPLTSVAVGEVILVKIPVTITGGASSSLTNQATASVAAIPTLSALTDNADGTTTTPTGITAPASTIGQTAAVGQNPTTVSVVAAPKVEGWKFVEILTDADGSQSPTVGDTLRWTIFYKNTGTLNVTNVVISDTLPAGSSLVGSAQISRLTPPAIAFTADSNTAIPTAAIATVVPNEVIRITLTTTITAAATPRPFSLDNQAALTASNLPVAGILTDNTITGTVVGVTPPSSALDQTNTTPGTDQTQAVVIEPVNIGGRVYSAVDNLAVRGTNPGIEGVTVTLQVVPPTGAPFTLTRVTNANGDYSAIIPIGSNVTITETQPSAFGNGLQNPSNTIVLNNVTAITPPQDFGDRSGTIAGQVWQDNGSSNGTFQATDTVLPNQVITLIGTDFGLDGAVGGTGLNADSPVTFSTRTDASGNYSFAPNAGNIFLSADGTGTAVVAFAGLRKGSYTVEQRNQPVGTADGITTAGAATTGGTAGTATALGINNPDAISTIILGAGQSSNGNNFAEVALSSLSGVVFQTNNNDNLQQLGEPGIGNVTVTLTGTNDLGQVVVITTNTATNAVTGGSTVVNNVSVNGGVATLVNVTIPSGGIAQGGYYFGNLRPATYTVTETQPANFISTANNTAVGTIGGGTAANNQISAVVLGSNQSSLANNFGELLPATLAGRVFRSVSNDNTFDAGDVGLGGQTITLTGTDDLGRSISVSTTTATTAVSGGSTVSNTVSINGSAPVATAITVPVGGVPIGGYFFGQLPASNASGYSVTETTQPALHSSTTTNTRTGNPASGTDANNAVSSIPVAFGNNLVNYDFGELQSDVSLTKSIDVATPTIGQNVVFTIIATNNGFSDNTGISVRDLLPSGYSYVSSVPVVGAGLTRTTVAGGEQLDWNVGSLTASGAASSKVLTVTATVNPTGIRSNFAQIQSTDVSDPNSQPGNNSTGTPSQNDEAAIAPSSVLAQPSIAGFVYLDVNNDGTRAATGENGLGSLAISTITLSGTDINNNPVSRTATPDPTTGAWSIAGLLPPLVGTTYTLTQTQPSNYTNRNTNVGTGATAVGSSASNVVTGINLQGNDNGVNYNFGELLADLSVTKAQINGTTIQAGQTGVQFQIVVSNAGPTQATGVVARDFLPAGYSFVSSSPATSSNTVVTGGRQLEWAIPTLNAGASTTITVTVNVAITVTPANSINFVQLQASDVLDPNSTPGDNATNRDTASNDDAESAPSISGLNSLKGRVYLDVNDNGVYDAATDLPLNGVQVTISGTDINGAVSIDAFTNPLGEYVFTNLLDTAGTGYTVTQTQPSTTTNRSTTAGNSGGTANSTGGATSGGQVTGISMSGTASLDYSEINFGELRADLSLTKTVISPVPPTEPQVGSNVTFRLTVVNSGETQTTGVVVTDVLPAGYTFVSSSNPSATNAAGTITWAVGTLSASGAGSSQVLDIVASVVANRTPAEYNNTAQITESAVIDPDSTPNNGTSNTEDDRANFATTPILVANLGITKTDGITAPASITAGSSNTYTIVVSNAGPSNITGAGVTDTLPSAFETANRSWACTGGTGATCPVAIGVAQSGNLATNINLNAGQTLTFTVTSRLKSPINGTISNTAEVAVPTAVVDPNPSNNTATDSTTITPGDVLGVVFTDTNGNGIQDLGEQGIPNIDVVLTDVNGIPRTAQTNATGQYTFLNIPAGTASLDVITSDPDFPAQHVQTAGTDPSSVTVISGGTVANGNPANAGKDGYQPQGDVSGVVFTDTNGNGVRDSGEAGIPNITVTLTDPFGVARSSTTGSNGTYSFSGVPAGTSSVVVDTTDPDFPLTHVQTAGTNPSTVTVVFGQSNSAGIDGFQPRGDLIGVVFYDTNGNGSKDPGEPPVSTIVTVRITDAFGGTRDVQTDTTGKYTALSVPAGLASVDVLEPTLPVGLTQTAGVDPSSVNVLVSKTVANGNPNNAGIDGYRKQGSVSGLVFFDTNSNGLPDAGEAGIPNVSLQITDAGGKVITVTTGSDGKYSATGVLEGLANVNVIDSTLPTGLTQTAGVDSSNLTVLPNQNNDAGFDGYRPQGSVFGRVFLDPNGNGLQDPNEPGIKDVDVVITDSAGKAVTVRTNANGDYSLVGVLEGTATVDVVDSTLPVGFKQTAGTDPSTVGVIKNIANNAGIDGYQQRGTLVGHVWRDDNTNQTQDGTEPNFANALVTITDASGIPITVRTDANGNYSVNVAAGPVKVEYTTPDKHRLTTANATQTITVLPAATGKAADVGYQPLFGSLKGRVFYDTNNNGIQNPNEPGIAGVSVEITDIKGNKVTAITDQNGDYQTADLALALGEVTVVVIDPSGHVLTTNNNPQKVQVRVGVFATVPNVGYVRPSIRLDKNVVVNETVIPRDQAPTVVIGGTLQYQISLTNNGVILVKDLIVVDTLPKSLKYTANSSLRVVPGAASVAIAEPVISTSSDGRDVLTWTFPGTLTPSQSIAIRFKTIVTPAANNGDLLNQANASGKAPNGTTTVDVQSNASIAAVKVSLGIFNPRTTIVGRVYFDKNNNDSFERDTDEPVQGARVYLTDGRWAVTDALGRYSIPEIAPGRYAVRLDPITAPFSCKRVPDGAPCTRYVVAQETGGITIEDFLLNPPTGAAVKSVSNLVQRGVVTVNKSIVQGGAGYAVTLRIVVEKTIQYLVITDPLPRGTAERGVPVLTGAGLAAGNFGYDSTSLRLNGTVLAGTYIITYPLFTPLPPDLVVTYPDIDYDEIFTLIRLPANTLENSSPSAVPAISKEVIR